MTISEQYSLSLPVEKIVFLKYLLESYEHLAIMRTLDRELGLVAVLAQGDTVSEVNALLNSVEDELGLKKIPRPDSLAGDWLLGEEERSQ